MDDVDKELEEYLYFKDEESRFKLIKKANDLKRQLLEEHPELVEFQKMIDNGMSKMDPKDHLGKAEMLTEYTKRSFAKLQDEVKNLKELSKELEFNVMKLRLVQLEGKNETK